MEKQSVLLWTFSLNQKQKENIMGLDQYVNKRVKKEDEVAYWRKNNQLQGWFEEQFDIQNCGEVELTEAIVKQLIEDIGDGLDTVYGFFYGQNIMNEDERAKLIKTFKDILKSIQDDKEDKYTFYYTCWY